MLEMLFLIKKINLYIKIIIKILENNSNYFF